MNDVPPRLIPDPQFDARLRPEMASLRLKVLGFVRQYLDQHGGSPSYGEIAAGLGTNRERVRKAVKRLIAAGELLRLGANRALALPADETQILKQLAAAGWRIDPAARSVTNRPLPVRVDLDYVPEPDRGASDASNGGRAGKTGKSGASCTGAVRRSANRPARRQGRG